MKREELEAMGLIEEQIDKVLDKYHEEHDPVKKDLETAQKDLENEKEKTSMQETTIADLKKGHFSWIPTVRQRMLQKCLALITKGSFPTRTLQEAGYTTGKQRQHYQYFPQGGCRNPEIWSCGLL